MSQTIQIVRRRPSFLDSSLRIDGIIDVLGIVAKEPLYLTKIHRRSKISMRKSIAKYVKYCVDNGFFSTYLVPRNGHGSIKEKSKSLSRYLKHYKITVKGRTFLEMVQ